MADGCEKPPQAELGYNPIKTGEMAEWLKAAVC